MLYIYHYLTVVDLTKEKMTFSFYRCPVLKGEIPRHRTEHFCTPMCNHLPEKKP